MSSKYDKIRIIGTGTFGNAWLVKSKLSRHPYVLKEINLNSLKETERQHALDEAAILAKLNHNHVIKYKEAVIEWDEKLSIFMEYAEGGDLSALIQRQEGIPFSEHQVIKWFIQICLALQYIHFQNILHRDLKTQNIFLTRKKIIKVGDFGIARVLQSPEDLAKTAVGTPCYLSPEIYQRRPYNHKSDIWALGCILFEMAALEHAFIADDFIHLVSLILKGKRKELPRHCSPVIRDLVQALLTFDPEQRPSTEEILQNPSLQPYLSEYVITYGAQKSFLPILMRPNSPNSRRGACSDVFEIDLENRAKRRASISAGNPKIGKRTDAQSKEKVESPSFLNIRARSTKKYTKIPSTSKDEKNEQKNDLTYVVTEPNFIPFNKKKSCLNFDTYRVSKSCSPRSSWELSKSDDMTLSDVDRGYQNGRNFLVSLDNPANVDWRELSSTSSKETSKKNRDKMNRAFRMSEDGEMSPEACSKDSNAARSHCNCHHFQCHQCMLDTLWKNRIRCCVRESVNKEEYSQLKNKLILLYKEEMFKKLYCSLTSDWGGSEEASTKNAFLSIMDSLNYEQVQSLPLMMQLVQLDLLISKQSSKGSNGDIEL